MEYLVAVSSSDGVMIDQHFGRTTEFHIFRVEDNENFRLVERRVVMPPCREGEHDPSQMAAAVAALSDCKYVLSAQIGRGAQVALQASGMIPLEIMHLIDYAMEKVMIYDKKFKHEKHERRN